VLAEAQDMVIVGMVGQAVMHEIVRKVVQLHGNQLQLRFLVDGPVVELASRPALTLSMILHELGTNATKYGVLAVQGGVVRIDWDTEDSQGKRYFVLRWREEGGPPWWSRSTGASTRALSGPGSPAPRHRASCLSSIPMGCAARCRRI
jgi:two-component sensor histidine kinase